MKFFSLLCAKACVSLCAAAIRTFCICLLVLPMLPLYISVPAAAQTFSTLYTFSGSDGAEPLSNMVFDSAGNLFGTTAYGGAYGFGAVFQLAPPVTSGGTRTETVLYSFRGGSDGSHPETNLAMDKGGNLYGATYFGGGVASSCNMGCGTVFKLKPPAIRGGAWTERIMHRFAQGNGDGYYPAGGVIVDSKGVVYGTTTLGGSNGLGTVFSLRSAGSGFSESVLYNFSGAGIVEPASPLTLDTSGNLYGTALSGQGGGVFRLTPPATAGGSWTESTLFTFDGGLTGGYPYAGVVMDQQGALYGVTTQGGAFGLGVIFKLSPPTQGTAYTETVLYDFTGGSDGGGPFAAMTLDRNNGVFYGPTSYGGAVGLQCGTVFKLVPPSVQGGSWNFSLLHTFTGGTDGCSADDALTLDPNGNLFGVTAGGGIGSGTVFEIIP